MNPITAAEVRERRLRLYQSFAPSNEWLAQFFEAVEDALDAHEVDDLDELTAKSEEEPVDEDEDEAPPVANEDDVARGVRDRIPVPHPESDSWGILRGGIGPRAGLGEAPASGPDSTRNGIEEK